MNTKTLLYQPTKNKQIWGQLYGSSLALALAEYCQQTPGIKLLITQDNLCASQLQDELQFFLNPNQNTQELLFFPTGKPCLMINSLLIKILFQKDSTP